MIGARLKQARLMAGLTQKQLAERLIASGCQSTTATISKYERGRSHPDASFMIAAASALDVSPSYLLHVPELTVDWLAFRKGSKLGKREREKIQAYATDIAELQIELQRLVYPGARRKLPRYAVSTPDEAEKAADQLRKLWDLGDRPLDCLVQVVEDRDVIVIGWADETGKFDGLSGSCGDQPTVVINTKRSADRIRFTLAHEIGHLVMDTSSAAEGEDENLAHRFAAALLVPAEHARRELGQKRQCLPWEEIKILKRKYGLSMAAWVRRAFDLGIVDEERYTEMNIYMSALGWRKREPVLYQGDEAPLQLSRLCERASTEGLVSADRFLQVALCDGRDRKPYEPGHLTVRDLMAMPTAERKAAIAKAFEAAAKMEFEILEANEVYDYDDAEYVIHD